MQGAPPIAFVARKAHLAEMTELRQGEILATGLLADRGITRVYWALETRHPGKAGRASMGGDFMVRVVHDGQPLALLLRAGECLVLGPHSWLVTEHEHAFVSLGVVLEARNPRLVLAASPAKGRRAPPPPTAPVEILPGLCDDTTMALAAALLAARTDDRADLYVRRLAEALWLRIIRFRVPVRGAGRSKANVTYGAAEHFVRDNLGRPINRREVARLLRITPSHVTRLFLRFAGETFGGYLLRARLEGSRKLLADPQLTVSEVGYISGFSSPNYFVRAYRRRYGVTPGRDRGGALPEHANDRIRGQSG